APRVHALLTRWMRWATRSVEIDGGCIFVAAASELDDTEGLLRESAVDAQNAWVETLRRAASLAVAEGHFGEDLACDQFAFEAYGILLSRHLYGRFLRHPDAPALTVSALRALLARAADGAPNPQPIPELA
ncbi:MAG: TetR/AcrR family transcriptional regulator, partial [Deltaproteobacteria bacterium]|nr:TetR/AcrR family transcriptional regulator [Deltaproteobacteria bacterium]